MFFVAYSPEGDMIITQIFKFNSLITSIVLCLDLHNSDPFNFLTLPFTISCVPSPEN